MSRLSRLAALVLTLLTAACVTSDPATEIERGEARAKAEMDATALAKAELMPLVPICLDALKGTAPDASAMAALGFRKTAVGYIKKRGETAMDRVNLTNTMLNTANGRCSIQIGNFASVNAAAKVVRDILVQEGFTPGGIVRGKGYAFSKGADTIYFDGVATHATTLWFRG